MKGAASAVVLLGFLAVAISGCIIPQDDAKAASVDSTSAPSLADNETANETANTAPILVVEIYDNGTLLTAADGIINASAGVNLTFDGGNSTDADGHNLTFAWDFGDGNSSEGSNTTHSYADAGNFTLNVTVTDEEGAFANTSIPLVVASSGPAPGTELRVDTKTWTGTITASPTVVSCGTGVGAEPILEWEIPALDEASGVPIKVSHFVLTMTGGATSVDNDLEFYDPDGTLIKSSAGASAAESIDVLGDFAPGIYTIHVVSCAAIAGSYSVTGDATIVVA